MNKKTMEHCPDWAKEVFKRHKVGMRFTIPLGEYMDLVCKKELVNAQMGCLAEWLELNQIEDMDTDCALIQFFGDRKVYAYVGGMSVGYVEYKIRFFSDGV